MSRILTSFSGKFGDILFSLPTVRAIAQMTNERVDMAIMPQYESLLPLIQTQPYVEKAFTIPEWICTGSPCGDQPWQPPLTDSVKSYNRCYHLGYRGHPGMNGQPRMLLVDFVAWQQGLKFTQNPLPFLTVPGIAHGQTSTGEPLVAFAFNQDYREQKHDFLNYVQAHEDLYWVDVSSMSWKDAAETIAASMAFVGCRSANYVLAKGVGQKNVLIYEPHPGRSNPGAWSDIFCCTKYGPERDVSTPEQAVEILKTWKEEESKCISQVG